MQRDHEVCAAREGKAGPLVEAGLLIIEIGGVEAARPDGGQRQIDRVPTQVGAFDHVLEGRPYPERGKGIVGMSLIYWLDRLRVGIQPMTEQVIQHEISEAIVEIRNQ